VIKHENLEISILLMRKINQLLYLDLIYFGLELIDRLGICKKDDMIKLLYEYCIIEKCINEFLIEIFNIDFFSG
jgi:hypothetical protein